MLRSKKMFDLCFRSLQGLPLPARSLTTLLIESIIGRLLRTEDVIVCGYVWMSNHVHMQLFSLDCSALTCFHGMLKKNLTDFLKRLLSLSRLHLWDGETTLGEVLDLQAGIDRIVYAYLNPVRAGLVRSIDQYSGCNTWREFLRAAPHLDSCIEKDVPWILAPDIEQLSQENPSLSEERRLCQVVRENAATRRTHTIRIYPFKWLQAFNISSPDDIERVRREIVSRVRTEEQRMSSAKEPIQRLEGYVVTASYLPPKKSRKVFMYGSTKEVRMAHLTLFHSFITCCRQCYEMLKQGARQIPWPPECFIPPAPRLCNAL